MQLFAQHQELKHYIRVLLQQPLIPIQNIPGRGEYIVDWGQ